MMRFDYVARQILKRRFFAWLRSIFGKKPLTISRLTLPVRVWGDADERREEALYLAAPTAFWLRPDRHLHSIPCWQIEGAYEPKPDPIYDPRLNVAQYQNALSQSQYQNRANHMAAQQAQLAGYQKTVYQNQLAAHQLQLSQYQQQSLLHGRKRASPLASILGGYL